MSFRSVSSSLVAAHAMFSASLDIRSTICKSTIEVLPPVSALQLSKKAFIANSIDSFFESHRTDNSVESKLSIGRVRWEWRESNGYWNSHSEEIAATIERYYAEWVRGGSRPRIYFNFVNYWKTVSNYFDEICLLKLDF